MGLRTELVNALKSERDLAAERDRLRAVIRILEDDVRQETRRCMLSYLLAFIAIATAAAAIIWG